MPITSQRHTYNVPKILSSSYNYSAKTEPPPLQRSLSAIADLLGFYLFSLMYHIEVNTKNGYEKNDNQQLIRRHYYHKCKKTFCTCFILVTFLRILTFFLTF